LTASNSIVSLTSKVTASGYSLISVFTKVHQSCSLRSHRKRHENTPTVTKSVEIIAS